MDHCSRIHNALYRAYLCCSVILLHTVDVHRSIDVRYSSFSADRFCADHLYVNVWLRFV